MCLIELWLYILFWFYPIVEFSRIIDTFVKFKFNNYMAVFDSSKLFVEVNHTCECDPYSLIKLDWGRIRYACSTLRGDSLYIDKVRETMLPVYRKILMADPCFFQNMNLDTTILRTISFIMEEDDQIGAELSDMDLIACANQWAERLSKGNHRPWLFHTLLRILFTSGYQPDGDDLYQRLCRLLGKGSQCADFKKPEMYCIIMAYLQIYRNECDDEQKRSFYIQLLNEWDFLKYLYSILLGYMVGFRHENFAGLANSLRLKKDHHAYLYLAYKAFKMNLDKLCPPYLIDPRTHRPVRGMVQVHLDEMEGIVKRTPKNRNLEPLCGILFPRKMKEVVEQVCPRTYSELEETVDQAQAMIHDLCALVDKSITEEDMKQEFDQFPAEIGLAYFEKVNSVMAANPKWQRMAPSIRAHILAKNTFSNVFIQNQMAPVYGNVEQQSISIGRTANCERN